MHDNGCFRLPTFHGLCDAPCTSKTASDLFDLRQFAGRFCRRNALNSDSLIRATKDCLGAWISRVSDSCLLLSMYVPFFPLFWIPISFFNVQSKQTILCKNVCFPCFSYIFVLKPFGSIHLSSIPCVFLTSIYASLVPVYTYIGLSSLGCHLAGAFGNAACHRGTDSLVQLVGFKLGCQLH